MLSAYIMPHPPLARPKVGKGDEKQIQKTLDAYKKAAEHIKGKKPETIIIISPHNTMYRDAVYISGGDSYNDDMSVFGASDDRIEQPYDTELTEEIIALAKENDIPVISNSGERGFFGYRTGANSYGERPDHGSAVPLLFVNEAYSDYKVVRLSPGFLSNETLLKTGYIITRAAENLGRRVSLIASGDLSHKLMKKGPYGFAKEGPVFDKEVTEAMAAADLKAFCGFDEKFADEAAQCGLSSFVMLAGALKDFDVSSDLLSYEGPFGVGYAVCIFECKDKCVQLAEASLENYVKTRKKIDIPEGLPEWMIERKAGVFVSIHKDGDLRGCIGTFLPTTENVAREIIELAVEAGLHDPRFHPVKEDELDRLVINVDVLSEPERCLKDDLDAKRYGVIVSSGGRRGLLLPNLEGIDNVDSQVNIALRKAGILPYEIYNIERFTVERHT